MDQFVEIGGHSFRYRVEGQGPWLVLVHGVSNRLETWDGVVEALGGRWRTLRYDMRGHGASAKPPEPYSIGDFVADLSGLMDAVGIDKASLAGFSLGGLVAQGFALDHPDRLDRLVLLSTVAGRNAQERERVLARLEIVADGIPGAHFRNSVQRWFTEEFQRNHPEVIDELEALNKQNDPKAYAAAYAVLAQTDFAKRLHEIVAPTLVVTGEEDQGSNPRMARLIHERIENSQLEILPRLRHSILVEAPDLVAGLISGFLASDNNR